ncbi:MAG: D-2-hydroxyacid dehydrogenase [Steroidobacteraceae bacterium]
MRRDGTKSFALATVLAAAFGAAWQMPVRAADAGAEALIEKYRLRESATPVAAWVRWRRPQRILVDAGVPGLVDAVKSAAPGVTVISAGDAAEMVARSAGADAAIGRTRVICSEPLLAAGRNLRWLQSIYAGVEACVDKPQIRDGKLLLSNMRAIAGAVIAEHAIAMLLALSRNLPDSFRQQMHGEWAVMGEGATMRTLQGKTLLVVGLGGIGEQVARRADALGMRVIATRASNAPAPPFVSYLGKPDELANLAASADAVVVTAPLTSTTRGMFDAQMFARMKPSAYLVNVSRGGLVVTDDLVHALEARQIAGAALDVTEPEPLPKDHPLWLAPNVILTPHVAAQSDLGEEAQFAVIAENVRRYVAGARLLSVVDVDRQY